MKALWLILLLFIALWLYSIGQDNDRVYNECIADGIHTNDRCYELAYM